ncbi:GNAT family N-acetyltransferase [Xanthomonadaceae bacterium XH05]|nr:GNAT family N-acetyltransferase [Xanthomonadaceae bacterium XH05]
MSWLLRPAVENDRDFCESLSRSNMEDYLVSRGIPWDSTRFLASWTELDNLMILAEGQVVGLLRLLPEQDALGLRDLQILPAYQGRGIGTWAVEQVQALAVERGYQGVQLRVYRENPALALYARLGFSAVSVVDGTIHMRWYAYSDRL